ncbi:MAG: DNA-binding domain-containing protein [Pseudomonadota bacterium]
MSAKRKTSNPSVSLAELQQTVQESILTRPRNPPAFITDTHEASAAERFDVYTEAYRLRLIEALAADYPALRDYLGDAGFDALGRAYADACPSDQFSIRWFGRYLPRFLRETPPHDAQLGLSDLASFEWALSEAFDAPDGLAVGIDRLAVLPPALWGSLRFRFHPSLRRVDLSHHAPQLWQASNTKRPLPALCRLEEPQAWVIWRSDLRLFFRSLPTPEAWSMDAFMDGRCFADICEGLCEWLDDEKVALNAAGFLQAWVRGGWIVDVATDSDPPSSPGYTG